MRPRSTPTATCAFKLFAGTPNGFYYYLGNSIIIGILSDPGGASGDPLRLRIFTLSHSRQQRLAVLHPVDTLFAAARGGGAGARHVPWFSLENTHLGLVLLYTSFNLSLAVWLMKGFGRSIGESDKTNTLFLAHSPAAVKEVSDRSSSPC